MAAFFKFPVPARVAAPAGPRPPARKPAAGTPRLVCRWTRDHHGRLTMSWRAAAAELPVDPDLPVSLMAAA